MADAISALMALECLHREVDAAYKKAKLDAEDYLDGQRELGRTSLVSTVFGEGCGEYKRGMTRAKEVTDYSLADESEFNVWLAANDVADEFVLEHAVEFAQWWFERTGEIPEGTTRVTRTEPPRPKAPQIYRYDHEGVKAKLLEGGNMLEAVNGLLMEGSQPLLGEGA